MHGRWLDLLGDMAALGVGWWSRSGPASHAERLSRRACRLLRRHRHDFQEWETELEDPTDEGEG